MWMSGLFVFFSLIIIAYKHFQLKKSGVKEETETGTVF
jgi:hypothetical protein